MNGGNIKVIVIDINVIVQYGNVILSPIKDITNDQTNAKVSIENIHDIEIPEPKILGGKSYDYIAKLIKFHYNRKGTSHSFHSQR